MEASFRPALEEFLNVPLREDEKEHHGQYPGEIKTQRLGELQTGTGIRLCNELIPAPAVAMTAEQDEHKGTERQDIVADDEVLKVKHTASRAKRLEARPQIEAQDTGNR